MFFFLISVNFTGIQLKNQTISNEKISLGALASAIRIVGDGELAANASSGYGNSTHPYTIENYNITLSETNILGIEIYNTSKHFVIQNCTISTADFYALWFINVSNYKLINNSINNNREGIVIQHSENGTIFNNSICNNEVSGITINYGINQSVLNNTINNNYYHGIEFGYKTNYSIISNNTINNNERIGIRLRDAHHNNITWNVLYYNGRNISEIEGSSNNLFENNDSKDRAPDPPPPNTLFLMIITILILAVAFVFSFLGIILYMKRFSKKEKLKQPDYKIIR